MSRITLGIHALSLLSSYCNLCQSPIWALGVARSRRSSGGTFPSRATWELAVASRFSAQRGVRRLPAVLGETESPFAMRNIIMNKYY